MDPNTPPTPETDIDKVPLTTVQQWGGQWRTLYEQKRRLHDVSIKHIVIGQVFTLCVVMAVSTFLELHKAALLAIGTTLLLYPALTETLSSNAAVLSASVHHDIENLPGSRFWNIVASILKTLFTTALASMVLGLLAGAIGAVFFETAFSQTLLLGTLSGTLTGLIGMPIMLVSTFIARHVKANPDTVTAPLETAIFSSLTLGMIMVVSRYLT